MIPLFDRDQLRVAIMLGLLLCLQGCYYMQAARGQLEVLRKREDIADLISSPDTPADLAESLYLVDAARRFSVEELGLPDNKSYRSYADIERDYVVWNVFAAPEFSLQARSWCFPIAGCVAYRGYFSEQAAHKEAARLKDKGFDVVVGGVSAYSTLGRFNDPVLNTMMHWDDTDLVATIFHELAHQVLYIKGDTGFNESFATAVEEFGIERWLANQGQGYEICGYQERRDLRRRLVSRADLARVDLEEIYRVSTSEAEKRALKNARLEVLSQDIAQEFERSGRDPSAWLETGLNNARLASMALYDGRLPAFRAMLRVCNSELDCFYAEATRLSKMDKEQRGQELADLHQVEDIPPVGACPSARARLGSSLKLD
jgi:predicted aminopeptidase